jgi:hypothetical protein
MGKQKINERYVCENVEKRHSEDREGDRSIVLRSTALI